MYVKLPAFRLLSRFQLLSGGGLGLEGFAAGGGGGAGHQATGV